MALKNLFDMVKADRYTADGREAIIKAQEAETEDVKYQNGDISQKTGLMKTPNGWVEPPKGKQPGAKRDTDPQTYIVKKNDELRKMYLNEKDPAKKEAMKKALKKQASMMEPEPFSSMESKPAESKPAAGVATKALSPEQQKKMESLGFKAEGDSFISESNGRKFEIKLSQQNNPYMSGPSTQAKLYIDGKQAPYTFGGGETLDPNSMVKIEKALKEQGYKTGPTTEETESKPAAGPSDEEVEIFKDIVREFKKNPNKKNEQIMNEAKSHLMKNRGMTPEQLGKIGRDIYSEKTKDSAPRQLTGDTRVKVRK